MPPESKIEMQPQISFTPHISYVRGSDYTDYILERPTGSQWENLW